MVFFVILFIISWITFFLYADKKIFFRFLPTCYLALILGFTTDLLNEAYMLWEYPASGGWEHFAVDILDELGIYFVFTYFFLQTLPEKQNIYTVFRHLLVFSAAALVIEIIALETGAMKHHMWWTLAFSYVADWVLLLIFYFHHRWVACK